MLKPKLAIYDFCGTLVTVQSLNGFADFVYSKRSDSLLIVNLCNVLYHIVKVIPLVRNSPIRSLLSIFRLYGITKADYLAYSKSYGEILCKSYTNDILLKTLKEQLSNQYLIIINSAGLSDYIHYWVSGCLAEDLTVIANDLSFKDGVCTGFMLPPNNFGKQKVVSISKTLVLPNFDLQNSFVYSDSITDLPLFNLVGNKFMVSNRDIKRL